MNKCVYGFLSYSVLFLLMFVLFGDTVPTYFIVIISSVLWLIFYCFYAACMTHAKIIDENQIVQNV